MVVNSTLTQHLSHLPVSCRRVYVGYSGGLDSSVLLHALVTANMVTPVRQIIAIHIHHGLSPHADAWTAHCQTVTQQLNIPLQIVRVDAKAGTGQSPEAAARAARYKAFADIIQTDDVLMLAHHSDDQAETFLLQLLRGAGVRGLSAMPAFIEFASGWLSRPLLSLSRQQLQTYATEQGLRWIDDESNDNTDFDRNYLRHHIMPLLNARWPAAAECISRSASHCVEADGLIQELATIDYVSVVVQSPFLLSTPQDCAFRSQQTQLDIQKLTQLDEPRQRNLLRYWLHQLNLPMPSAKKLQQILQTVIHSRHDATPIVNWPGAEVRRFRHHLYAMPPLPLHDVTWQCEWDVQRDLVLPADIGVLKAKNYKELAAGKALTIKFRQGGEVIALPGRAGHHSLKKLMQEWNIPPWLRDRIPLIYRDGELVHVAWTEC